MAKRKFEVGDKVVRRSCPWAGKDYGGLPHPNHRIPSPIVGLEKVGGTVYYVVDWPTGQDKHAAATLQKQ